jgi:hypothetical protein
MGHKKPMTYNTFQQRDWDADEQQQMSRKTIKLINLLFLVKIQKALALPLATIELAVLRQNTTPNYRDSFTTTSTH